MVIDPSAGFADVVNAAQGVTIVTNAWGQMSMRSAYSGPVVEAQRVTGGSVLGIGVDASVNKLRDDAALEAFRVLGGASHVNMKTLYDQVGSINWTSTVGGTLHRIADTATGVIKVNNLPTHRGLAGGGYDAATLGMVGSQNVCIVMGMRAATGVKTFGMRFGVQLNDGKTGVCVGVNASNRPVIGAKQLESTTRREFTPVNLTTGICNYISTWYAGGNYGTGGGTQPTCVQDGNVLTEQSNSTGTIDMGLGSYYGGYFGDSTNAEYAYAAVLNAIPTPGTIAAINAWAAQKVALAA